MSEAKADRPAPNSTASATLLPSNGRAALAVLVLLTLSMTLSPLGASVGGGLLGHTAASPSTGAPLASPIRIDAAGTSAVPGAVAAPLSSSALSASTGLPLVAHAIGGPTLLPLGASVASYAHPGLSTYGPVAPLAGGPSNQYVNNEAWFSDAATVGGSPTHLVATGVDFGTEANATVTTFFQTHGDIGISLSTNGGSTWSTNWPAQATAWTGSGPAAGDILTDPLGYGTGYNLIGGGFELWNTPPNAFPQVVSSSSGGALVMAATYNNICWYLNLATCTANGTYDSTSGVAVVTSSNGGLSWSTPIPVSGQAPDRGSYYSNGCSGLTGTGILRLPGNQTTGLALAMGGPSPGGKNYVYLAIAKLEVSETKQGWYCDANGNLQLAFTAMNFALEMSVSSDSGSTWSAPKAVANVSFPASALGNLQFPIAPLLLSPHLTVGPAPKYTLTGAYLDVANLSTVGLFPIATFTNLTATTFGAPTGIGQSTWAPDSSGSDWFVNGTTPFITADNWSTSSHKGNLYIAYDNNRTASPGSSAIDFTANRGSGWSTPVVIASSSPNVDVNPTVAVEPNGTIWVSWISVVPSTGYYSIGLTFSADGGATWAPASTISNAANTPIVGQFAVGLTTILATSSVSLSFWSDCRSAICQSGTGVYNWTVYMAQIHIVDFTATAASGINATVSFGGVVSTFPLPALLAWDTNASVTVNVTTWTPTPNGTWIEEFSGFSGASTATTNPATFTYAGGNLVAKYTLTPGSWLDGTISPIISGTHLTISATAGTVSAKFTPSGGANDYNVTVPGGSAYTLTVSAPRYAPQTTTTLATNFKESWTNFTLVKINGWLKGLVEAVLPATVANAVVTVNGSTINPTYYNGASGSFNVTVPWGFYWVNISESGYLAVRAQVPYTVNPGVTTVISNSIVPTFLFGDWINGSLAPSSARLTINGNPVSLNYSGSSANFNVPLPGGTFDVVASLSGYSVYDQNWTLTPGPGQQRVLTISLTNRGTITGTVTPNNVNGAVPTVTIGPQGKTGSVVALLANGQYSDNLVASSTPYEVTVTLSGYVTQWVNLTLQPGMTIYQNFSLQVSSGGGPPPPNCTTDPTLSQCQHPTTGNNNSASGLSTGELEAIGIGVVVVAVVVLVAVMLMRRPPAQPMPASPNESGEAPSDGSEAPGMGPTSPP